MHIRFVVISIRYSTQFFITMGQSKKHLFPHFFSWKDGDYGFCVNFANI